MTWGILCVCIIALCVFVLASCGQSDSDSLISYTGNGTIPLDLSEITQTHTICPKTTQPCLGGDKCAAVHKHMQTLTVRQSNEISQERKEPLNNDD